MNKDYIAMFLKDNGLEYGQWFKMKEYSDTDLEFMIEPTGRLKCSDPSYFSTEGLDNLLRDLLIGSESVITLGEKIAKMVGAKVNIRYDVCVKEGDRTVTKGRITFFRGEKTLEFVNYVGVDKYSSYAALGELLLGKAVLK